MSDVAATYPVPIRTLTIADRRYELHRRRCTNCEDWHYRIWRWRGAAFANYVMPPDFDEDDFEDFVASLDDVLLMDAPSIFAEFRADLDAINSQAGIAADHSYGFQLMEYGRQRASILNEMNMIPAIANPEEPETPMGRAVRAAFEFGSAAAEHRFMAVYEEYVNAGIAQEDWRLAGLPKAREERIRHGKRTRAAIVAAARDLYDTDDALRRNDSETARRIQKLDLPDLDKGNGTQVSVDTITRHLRSAREEGTL